MRFNLTPGNAMGCAVNSHRAGWDGSICSMPSGWNCGQPQHFRDDFCEIGVDRCYHTHVFDAAGPYLVVNENGCDWILREDPEALNDQLLLLWGRGYNEPHGIRDSGAGGAAWNVFGVYRIKEVEARSRGHQREWIIRPHEDGWVRIHNMRLHPPRWDPMLGPYIKQIDRAAIERFFAMAKEAGDSEGAWYAPEDKERFDVFHGNLVTWLDGAAEQFRRVAARTGQRMGAAYGSLSVANGQASAPYQSVMATNGALGTTASGATGASELVSPAASTALRPGVMLRNGGGTSGVGLGAGLVAPAGSGGVTGGGAANGVSGRYPPLLC